MKLSIYNKDGGHKMAVSCEESCTHDITLQGENIISLSFTGYECIGIDVNDYVDFLGERFWAVERYVPEQVSTVEWNYNVKFYGIQSLISRFLVLKLVDGDNDTEFTLTAPASVHAQLIVDSINAGMGTTDWKVGEVIATENLVIDYIGTYCNEGLAKLAEAADTEYWFDGMTVNLCRCEHGDSIELGYGKGLTELSKSIADNVKFFTRLFPVGSSRNIDSAKYGSTRLQLPSDMKFIDRDTDIYGIIHHYEKDAFADIYPRRIGTVSSVRVTDSKSDDGTSYKIYWFKDDSLDFNPNDYEIAGLVKHVTFQSGELNGRDFEVNYYSEDKEFEIITQWPYDDDTQVPGGSLVPKAGDKYILWNITMPDEYYVLAEQELLKAANDYMDENRKDVSVYKSHTDFVNIGKRQISLSLGRRIRLQSTELFPETGYKDTRITRISRRLDCPEDMDIEMSDVLSKGTISQIKDSITHTKNYIDVVAGSLPGIIKSWESTPPTDSNLMSSAKTLLEVARRAISRVYDDTVNGVISFLRRIKAFDGIEFGRFQTDKPGAGGAVLIDNEGNSTAEVDFLKVRKTAHFNRLTIQETKHVGGRSIMSPASMSCSRVEETETAYRCYFETSDGDGKRIYNQFEVGDQAIRQTFNEVQSVYYWRLVTAVGEDFIELSKSDCDTGSGAPAVGDEVVQLGNRTNKKRQAAQILSAYGTAAPSYEVFQGIDSYSLAGKNIAGIIYNPETGEPQTYCFGEAFIGDRDVDNPDSQFLTFQKKEGSDRKALHLKGSMHVTSGSSGLTNLSEWAEKQQQIDDAQETADKAQEDATKAINDAENAQSAADSANRSITGIKNFTDTAFVDGIIDRSEAAAIEKYKNTVNETKSSVDALYAELYNNPQLSGTPKSNLAAAKTAFDIQCTELLSAIDVAIADNVTSASEKAAVDTAYTAFNEAYKVFSQRIEEASDAIRGIINDTANNAQSTANSALTKAQEAKDYIDKTLPGDLAEINKKLDGVVENFFYSYTPTTANEPAATWIKDGTQAQHIGDTFTNTQAFISDTETPDAGKSWRWVNEGGYKWTPIADSDAVKALQEAARAQDTADGKSRTFVVQPTPPYSVGDMWMQGSGGEILRCIVSRESGAYTASDWDKGSKYTDDTYAKERFAAMAEDGVITKEEKSSLRNILSQIEKEFAAYKTDAASFGVSINALQTAYTNITTYMTGTLAVNDDTDTTVTDAQRTTYNTYMAAYASEVSRLSNVIAQKKADDAVNNLKIGGVNLINDSKYSVVTPASSDFNYNEFPFNFKPNETYTVSVGKGVVLSEEIFDEYSVCLYNKTTNHYLSDRHILRVSNDRQVVTIVSQDNYSQGDKVFLLIYAGIAGSTANKSLALHEIQLEVGNKATDWSPSPIDVQNNIDKAQQTADDAVKDAESALTELGNITSDSKISPPEKTSLQQQLSDINAEYTQIIAQANQYAVATTDYSTAYTAAKTALTKYTAATPEYIDIADDYANISAYYVARQAILDAIAVAAKKYADDMTVGTRNLIAKKFMVDWNLVNSSIVRSGYDKDGYYYEVNQETLYSTIGGENNHNDIFQGKIKYKENTQYCFRVKWRLQGAQDYAGLVFYFFYADGTNEYVMIQGDQTSVITQEVITAPHHTLSKIAASYGTNRYCTLIYEIQLTEGNKQPADWIIAEEDKAVSNVNLLKRSNVELNTQDYRLGALSYAKLPVVGKEYTMTVCYTLGENNTYIGFYLLGGSYDAVRVSQHGSRVIETKRFVCENAITLGQVMGAYQFPNGTYGSKVHWAVLVEGHNAPQEWIPSQEEIDEQINLAQSTADEAKQDVADLSSTVSDLDTYIDGAFANGIIEKSEAIAIEKYLNQVNESWQDLEATYNVVYASPYLSGTPKVNLLNAKITLAGKKDALISAINTAIADGKTTSAESAAVDTAFAAYNTSVADFKTALENANKAISDTLKAAADNAQSSADLAQGYPKTFNIDLRDTAIYDEDKYYLVTINPGIGTMNKATFVLKHHLTESWGKPSWSTHSSGFTCEVNWSDTMSGWGAIIPNRIITDFGWLFVRDGKPPMGSIGQISEGSLPYIYCRGGALYKLAVSGATTPTNYSVTVHTSDYHYKEDYPNSWRSSPISEVTVPKALNEKFTSRYDYLESTFGPGADYEGVVLSKMAAVRDDEGVVVAALNGSEIGKDTAEHGKALIVSGCAGVSDESFKNAATKIYEDGTIDTKKLIARDGGKIGKFEIYKGTLTSFNNETKEQVDIDNGRLVYAQQDTEKVLSAWVSPGEVLLNTLPLDSPNSQATTIITPDGVEIRQFSSSSAFKSNVFNKDGIELNNGLFKGLRPNTRTVTGNMTLTALDHTILIDTLSAINIKLPSSPQEGQEYVFYAVGTKNETGHYNIVAQGGLKIHDPIYSRWNMTTDPATSTGIVKYICAKDRYGVLYWWSYRLT